MSGIQISISVVDKELSAALDQLYSNTSNLEPFHRDVGEHFLNSIQDNFDDESTPDGEKWQAHSPATVQSRLRRNGNAPLTLLRESGELAGSFNYEATSGHAKIGTPVIYAAIHNNGGEAGRGLSVNIPAREFMGMGGEDETAIRQIAEDYLKG